MKYRFAVRDDGIIDAHYEPEHGLLDHALNDAVSSRAPRRARHQGLSTYWIDHDATADELVAYFEAVSGGPHPDWDEYRAAMVEERRIIARLRPTRAVGQING